MDLFDPVWLECLAGSQGFCRPVTMPGFLVTLAWNNPRSASDIEVRIEAVRSELLSVLTGDQLSAVTKRRKRVLQGKLPDLHPVIKRLKEGDELTIAAILYHGRGDLELDPCDACRSTKENLFGGCFTLRHRFGNTYATCLINRRNAT